ncbi:elements of external origin [Bartonella sp. DGB2]|uniref:elements of external origin n=1 Tax=Bartonella sp. DGB2 TaxID=3388426 RepID=UPI0039901869
MGLSIRAYARQRGVSDTAVRKAIKQGRITAESDGTIDGERADREWLSNTVKPQIKQTIKTKPSPPAAAVKAVEATLREHGTPVTSGGTTYMQAKTANEVLKAQTNRVRLQQLKNELIDRNEAIAHVFRLARQERDAWQTWPARISSQMATELGTDAHLLHVTLERYVREHLEELGGIKVNFKQ